MTPSLDIHNYALQYKLAKRGLERAQISQANRKLIKSFEQTCNLEGLSIPRRLKLMGSLVILARDYLKKDFRKTTKQDLKETVIEIDDNEKYEEEDVRSFDYSRGAMHTSFYHRTRDCGVTGIRYGRSYGASGFGLADERG